MKCSTGEILPQRSLAPAIPEHDVYRGASAPASDPASRSAAIVAAWLRAMIKPPAISDKATIANSSERSTSVSRGERSAYQKCRYHDLCGWSGAIAIASS